MKVELAPITTGTEEAIADEPVVAASVPPFNARLVIPVSAPVFCRSSVVPLATVTAPAPMPPGALTCKVPPLIVVEPA